MRRIGGRRLGAVFVAVATLVAPAVLVAPASAGPPATVLTGPQARAALASLVADAQSRGVTAGLRLLGRSVVDLVVHPVDPPSGRPQAFELTP